MSMMVRLARVLFSFSPWDEIPLRESLLVSSYSEMEETVI